jgi:hypothetical protein
MHGRHAQATRHDDDEGQSGRGRRAGRKEELFRPLAPLANAMAWSRKRTPAVIVVMIRTSG